MRQSDSLCVLAVKLYVCPKSQSRWACMGCQLAAVTPLLCDI